MDLEFNISQLKDVEYLFVQSAQGNHVLFKPEHIKQVFTNEKSTKDFYRIQNMPQMRIAEINRLLETLMVQPTLLEKKKFIEDLSEKDRGLLIRAYFSILDYALFQNKNNIH